MRQLFHPGSVNCSTSCGLLVLRLVVGAAFLFHGWPKVQNPTGWLGSESSMPGILQAMAAATEFGGGLALIAGLLTRVTTLGIGGVMVVALATVHIPHRDPFVGKPGQPSAEAAAFYLACMVLFLRSGPGRLSLDALLFGGGCCRKGENRSDVSDASGSPVVN